MIKNIRHLLDLLCDLCDYHCVLIGLLSELTDVPSFVFQQHHISLEPLQPLGGVIQLKLCVCCL